MKKIIINFTDLHDKMVQVRTGLITKTVFKKWLSDSIVVEEYLPIRVKYSYINVVSDILKGQLYNRKNDSQIDIGTLYIEYDILSMFHLLFTYTNIKFDFDDVNSDNYDLIKRSGVYDYIIKQCKNDYLDLIQKCDNVVGVRDFNLMNEMVGMFGNYPKIDEINQMKDIVNQLDENKLGVLKNIEIFNNPTITKLLKDTESNIIKNIESDKNE